MPEWITNVDETDALKREWNRRFIRQTIEVDPAQTAAVCHLLLAQPLSDDQRAAFQALLLDPNMTDALRLQLLGELRSVLVDVEVSGGMTLPAELAALADHSFTFEIRAGLKVQPA